MQLEVSKAIPECYSAALSYHGDFALTLDSFKQRILRILEIDTEMGLPLSEFLSALSMLNSRDLYLTTACAYGNEDAWKRFHLLYRQSLVHFARPGRHDLIAAEDLADAVLVHLFLSDRSGQSRIYSYNGKGSLLGWLRVIVERKSISAIRVRDLLAKTTSLDDPMTENRGLAVLHRFNEGAYEHHIANSLRMSCDRLKDEERQLLLWRYGRNFSLRAIANMMGIHQANVTRRLEKLLAKIRHEVVTHLNSKYRLNEQTITECLSDMLNNSYLSFSLLEHLNNTTATYARCTSSHPHEVAEFSGSHITQTS